MTNTELGVIFAVATAFAWAGGGVIHTAASRMVGIYPVMLVRQLLASIILGLCGLALGEFGLLPARLLWLAAASGLVGIILCDICFYTGALAMGLRPAQVCQSLSACFTALLGGIFLNEEIGLQGWLGMAVSTGGVILVVVSEQSDAHNPPLDRKKRNFNIFLALLSALFLALGMIFSKQALDNGLSALSLAFYRNFFSSIALWSIALARGRVRFAMLALRQNPRVFKLLPLGCLLGPSGGIWLSCMAIEYLPAAIAAMLMSLEPIAIIIILSVVERRLPARGSIAGALVACSGAVILLMR